jgi:hypothetical protein
MTFRKLRAAAVAGALVSCVGLNVAPAQVTGQAFVGRVYAFHTKAIGGCRALDWHIIVGENDKLSGIIGLDDMKTNFAVMGTYDAKRNFHLDGKEIGGTRTAALNGQVRENGVMVATLGGLPVGSACQGKSVYVRWNSPVEAFADPG